MLRSPTYAGLLVLASACGSSHGDGDHLPPTDLGGADAGDYDAGPPPPLVCGGATCADGEYCCFATLTCASSPAACSALDGGAPSHGGACSSNADCLPDDLCAVPLDGALAGRCGGAGICSPRVPRDGCPTPVGSPLGVCGCDGYTYASMCAAFAAGVRVAAPAPCGTRAAPDPGVTTRCTAGSCHAGWTCDSMDYCQPDATITGCGTDSQCGSAQHCCYVTGLCVDDSRPELCAAPPTGTLLPCTTTDDCGALNDGMLPGPRYYCDGEGCTGFGGCRAAPDASDCGGALMAVCGCDGVSYANPCWASEARTRVAHTGMCM